MPFIKRHRDEKSYERLAKTGEPFIDRVHSWDLAYFWTRIVRASQVGIIVIDFHRKPLGVLGPPAILVEILQSRRHGTSPRHADLSACIEQIATTTPFEPDVYLHTRRVKRHLRGVSPRVPVRFLRDLNERSEALALARSAQTKHIASVFIPATALARYWRETTTAFTPNDWAKEMWGWTMLCSDMTTDWERLRREVLELDCTV
jgi:hypothetical protein